MFIHKYILILSCTLMLSVHFGFSQAESDSLLQEIENYPEEDTLKVQMLLDLGNSYWRSSPEKSELYAKEGWELAEKLNYKFGMARACAIITNALISKGDLERGMEYARLTLQKSNEAGFLLGEGHAHKFMGTIHYDQGNLKEAKTYFEEAIEVYSRLKNEKQIGNTLINLAIVYGATNELDSALYYFNQVSEMEYVQRNKIVLGGIMNNTGVIYQEKGEWDEAIAVYLKSLEIRREAEDRMGEVVTLENLGNTHRLKGNYTRAEKYLLEALHIAEELKLVKDLVSLYQGLVGLEKEKKNYAKALAYYDKYSLYHDSLLNEAKIRQIAELQTQYETEKKEKEIAALQLDNQIRAFWQKTFAVGLLLVMLAAFFIFLFYRYRSRINLQLLEAQQNQTHQLQEVDRMKSRFFANISHEFRTPLTLILGSIDALQEGVKQDGKPKLHLIHRHAHRLLKLINQLLDLSKIEAGKLSLKTTQGNIVPFARGLFHSFHSMAEKKAIVLDFNCPEKDIFLYYEAEKIEKVITNLLSNAVKFTPKHGKISFILQRNEWNGKACLEMVVKDTGVGIAKDQLPYVFNRFFQADASDTKEHEGTGIGLSLVKELVALHQGEITVESEVGTGTTFHVFLPLGKDHLQEDEVITITTQHQFDTEIKQFITEEETIETAEPHSKANDKANILIVEDHPDLRAYIRSALIGEYNIIEATNGLEGLESAINNMPSLIISDVMMPKMNGNVLCKKLKKDIHTSHIPLILLTAKTTQEDKLKGLENQADEYLIKPFDIRELKVRIKNLISQRQQLQEKFRSSVILKPSDIEVSSMEQVFLEKLMLLLEENLSNEHFGVEQLSEAMGMSRGHLHRKLQALTNHSPSQFVRRFRLQRAMDLLQKKTGNIAEIAYTVGFSSPTYFTKCFTEQYGYPPKEVKSQPQL